jgi:hypothetical protein
MVLLKPESMLARFSSLARSLRDTAVEVDVGYDAVELGSSIIYGKMVLDLPPSGIQDT